MKSKVKNKNRQADPTYSCFYLDTDQYENFDQRRREDRVSEFRKQRYYGPECDKITCIGSRGNPVSWKGFSSGVSWIGVTGTDTTCVVTMNNLDKLRRGLYGKRQLQVEDVVSTALVDMGVRADSPTSFRQRVPCKAVVPFAVVSVAPDAVVEGHLKISRQLQEQASHAINYLEAKLKNWSRLSSNEAIQIAVCALKYLLGPKFKSDEIRVVESGKYERRRSGIEIDSYLAVEGLTSTFVSWDLSSPEARLPEDA